MNDLICDLLKDHFGCRGEKRAEAQTSVVVAEMGRSRQTGMYFVGRANRTC